VNAQKDHTIPYFGVMHETEQRAIKPDTSNQYYYSLYRGVDNFLKVGGA
jgi:hypothetical protein